LSEEGQGCPNSKPVEDLFFSNPELGCILTTLASELRNSTAMRLVRYLGSYLFRFTGERLAT
jgi:hypothetical protein